MNEKADDSMDEVFENSKPIMASYQFNQFFSQWITGPFGFFVFFFYEAEIGLPVILAGTAFIIYSIWNAINDPLVGYMVENIKMPWSKKGYKRFPWIVIGAIPWLFSFLMIFLVPEEWYVTPSAVAQNQIAIFLWYVITLCLYDTLFTLWNVNATALYPDKFVGLRERRVCTTIGTLIGMAGIVVGSVVPPLFITTGVSSTYRTAMWISVGIGMILFFIMLPGNYEGKKLRERYIQFGEKKELVEKEPFFKGVKRAVTDKRLMLKVLFFFGYQAAVALLSASAQYMITYVLQGETFWLSILMGAMLIGAIISVPLWGYFSQKLNNNKKLSLYAGVAMFVTFIPIFLTPGNIYFYLVALILFGVGLGGQWFADPPTMGDVQDDLAVRTGKREAAFYYGINAFFIRLSGTFQALIFVIVHLLTGFPAGVTSYEDLLETSPTPELALWGIRVHAALIPAILVLITIFIFWKYYDITPELVAENKKKLKEMGL